MERNEIAPTPIRCPFCGYEPTARLFRLGGALCFEQLPYGMTQILCRICGKTFDVYREKREDGA